MVKKKEKAVERLEEAVRLRTQVAEAIQKAVRAQDLDVDSVSQRTGIHRSDFSRIMNRRLDRFSLDRLVHIALALGIGVTTAGRSPVYSTGIDRTLAIAVQFLTLSLGPAYCKFWPLSGAVIPLLSVLTLASLAATSTFTVPSTLTWLFPRGSKTDLGTEGIAAWCKT